MKVPELTPGLVLRMRYGKANDEGADYALEGWVSALTITDYGTRAVAQGGNSFDGRWHQLVVTYGDDGRSDLGRHQRRLRTGARFAPDGEERSLGICHGLRAEAERRIELHLLLLAAVCRGHEDRLGVPCRTQGLERQ